jgi:hypothetical protein
MGDGLRMTGLFASAAFTPVFTGVFTGRCA